MRASVFPAKTARVFLSWSGRRPGVDPRCSHENKFTLFEKKRTATAEHLAAFLYSLFRIIHYEAAFKSTTQGGGYLFKICYCEIVFFQFVGYTLPGQPYFPRQGRNCKPTTPQQKPNFFRYCHFIPCLSGKIFNLNHCTRKARHKSSCLITCNVSLVFCNVLWYNSINQIRKGVTARKGEGTQDNRNEGRRKGNHGRKQGKILPYSLLEGKRRTE